jgi:tetratricopeptide (TPR) repeat protein
LSHCQLGNIKDAFKDINYAIELEPSLIDAYWHRHLLNVLLNRRHQAVEDLNMLLQLKKSHVPALKSR